MARVNHEEPDFADARVQVSYETFHGMKVKIAEQETEIERLKGEVQRLVMNAGGHAGDVGVVVGLALREALTIVGFAIGNLHPLTVRGWPYPRLMALAELVADARLPQPLIEPALVLTWRDFAELAKKWEDARARGEEQALLAEENLGRAITPDALAAYGLRSQVAPPAHGEPMLLTPIAPEDLDPEPVSNADGVRND